MALDQGTTSSRCMIFDKKGNIVTKAQQEFDNYYPQAGFVEQDGVHDKIKHGKERNYECFWRVGTGRRVSIF